MPDYEWVLVYDAATDVDRNWVVLPMAILFIVVAVGALRARRFERDALGETIVVRGSPDARKAVVLAAVCTFVCVPIVYCTRSSLVSALRERRYVVVQGEVTDFQGTPPLVKGPETWTVAGHRYELGRRGATSGFRERGVVRAGMYVRIADVDGAIARLEIARGGGR